MTIQAPTSEAVTPKILRLYLWLKIGIHVICGACTLSFVFPFLDRKSKDRKTQDWAKRLLKIFGLRVVVQNPEILPKTTYLLASNHISWIDIHVINSFRPIRFVAKSEVASWPIFGWMAKHLGTVFIRRDSSRHARQVVGQMAEVLQTECICIFPEGTSTAGEIVLPFRPNLFESAVVSNTPVYSLAIRYVSNRTGLKTDIPAFIGDMGLLESMSRILKNRNLTAQLRFIAPPQGIPAQEMDRKQLALYSQEAIAGAIEA